MSDADNEPIKTTYYERNKEAIADKKKIYREANKEEINKKKKIHYQANKEKIAEKSKIYREVNKKELKEKYEANKEKRRARASEKVSCECGYVCSRGTLTKHKKLGWHLRNMNEMKLYGRLLTREERRLCDDSKLKLLKK